MDITAFVSSSPRAKAGMMNYFQPASSQLPFTTRTLISNSMMTPRRINIDPSTKDAALGYFRVTQLPATLIAALSLIGLFALTENVNNTSELSKLHIFLLRLYHLTSLLSFCLSLLSIITSVSASTLLCVSDFSMIASKGTVIDVYHFLNSSMEFEFLFSRWSFLVSVAFFFLSTTMRMVLQFELFKYSKRKLAGCGVLSTMTGFISFLIGYINTTQKNCSFFLLTQQVFKVKVLLVTLSHSFIAATLVTANHVFLLLRIAILFKIKKIILKCAFINRQPMFILSSISFAIGSLLTIRFLMPDAVEHDQLIDHDRYT